MTELYSPDPNVGNRALAQMVGLINELSTQNSEFIEQKYMVLLQMYSSILEQGNDLYTYAEITEKYINIGMKYFESITYLAETAQKVCNV